MRTNGGWVRLLGFGAVAAVLAAPVAARGEEVLFAGSTGGAFNGGTSGSTATLLGLVFDNSTFSATTSNGFLGIGNNASPGSNVNNLGSFRLAATPQSYGAGANTFSLLVTFTAPAGITGGQSTTYAATVSGSVTSQDNGGVRVDFDNTPKTFAFAGAQGNGTFTFSVNDVSITAGDVAPITGTIQSSVLTPVPEPASVALLGSGLAGVGAVARRRRRR